MNLKYKIIYKDDELNSLRSLWENLEKNNIGRFHVSSSFNWVWNWWKVFENVENNIFGFNKKLSIFCIYKFDELVAILPFMIVTRKVAFLKLNFLEFIGQQWGATYCDCIVKKGVNLCYNDIKYFINEELNYDVLHLRYLTDSTLFFKKDEMLPFSIVPEINLTNYKNKDEYISSTYSKGLKQNLRTGSNRAKKNNDNLNITIENIDNNNFSDIVKISKTKELQQDKGSFYNNLHKKKFIWQLCSAFESNVIFVKINDNAVAYRVNIIYGDSKICIDASYDRNAPKYELGITSVDANITDSFDKNLKTHSFGTGSDNYKFRFNNSSNLIYFKILKGNTFLSRFKFYIIKLFLEKRYKKSYNKLKIIKGIWNVR